MSDAPKLLRILRVEEKASGFARRTLIANVERAMNLFKKRTQPKYSVGQKVYWQNSFSGGVYLAEILSVDESKSNQYIIKTIDFGSKYFAVSEDSLWKVHGH